MDDEDIEKRLRGRAENAAFFSCFLVFCVLGLIFFVLALLGQAP